MKENFETKLKFGFLAVFQNRMSRISKKKNIPNLLKNLLEAAELKILDLKKNI